MAKTKKRTGDPGPITPTETETLPQSVGDTTAADADRDRIATRAYERYLARGGSDGNDMEDWLEAERELRGGGETSTRSNPDPSDTER